MFAVYTVPSTSAVSSGVPGDLGICTRVACYLVLCTGAFKLFKNVSGSQLLCLGLTSLWKELVNHPENSKGKIGVSLSSAGYFAKWN